MKNYLFTLLILLISAFTLSGQVLFNPNVSVVLPITNQTYLDAEIDSKTSYAIGMNFRIGSKAWRLHPGIHYQPRKFSMPTGLNESASLTAHTIQIPLTFAYYLTSRDSPLNLLFRAGGTAIFHPGDLVVKHGDDMTLLLPPETNSFVFAGNIGLTLDLAIFTLDLAYTHDFLPFFKDSSQNSNAISLSIGYLF